MQVCTSRKPSRLFKALSVTFNDERMYLDMRQEKSNIEARDRFSLV